MKICRWLVLLLAMLSAGLLIGASRAILDTGDQVVVRREVLEGNPEAVHGLQLRLPVTCGRHLFWDTVFPADAPEKAETSFSSHLLYRASSYDQKQTPPGYVLDFAPDSLLPEGGEAQGFWSTEDGTHSFLLTREAGMLRLRTFDGAEAPLQVLDLFAVPSDAPSGNIYTAVWIDPDFFVPLCCYLTEDRIFCRFAVVSRQGDDWALSLTSDVWMPISPELDSVGGLPPFYYLRLIDMDFNGERLAVLEADRVFSPSAFSLAVCSEAGVEYLATYKVSSLQASASSPIWEEGTDLVWWTESAS